MQGQLTVFAQPLTDGVLKLQPVEAENANDDSATNDCAIVRVPVNTAPPHDGVDKLCSAPVHGITNPVNYARNQARQQQAEEAERGQHREKQLV